MRKKEEYDERLFFKVRNPMLLCGTWFCCIFFQLKKKKRNFLQSLMDFSQFISRGMEYIFQCGLNVFIISQGVHKMFEKISVERKGRKKTLGI